MSRDAAVRRQELRRSNAAVPFRNRYREAKARGRSEFNEWDYPDCGFPCFCDCGCDCACVCGCGEY